MKDQSVDGLRGLAALSVVASHFLLAIYPTALSGYFPWVVAPTALHGRIDALLSLPVLSSLWNGNVAVLIFFVLSGYVLTLPFTRGGIPDEIRGRMLRRLPRLAVPIFGSVVFAYAVMLVTHRLPAVVSPLTGSVWLSIHWNLAPSFPTALQDAVYGALLRGSTYNSALWTMRIEFIGSMLIFAYCLLEAPERRNLCAFLFGGYCLPIFLPSGRCMAVSSQDIS